MENVINNQTKVELPIVIINYDPVSRQIVKSPPIDERILVANPAPQFFDCSYVYVPAWR